MINVVSIFTCFNRRDKTENCIKTLVSGNPQIDFEFVIVDDNSNDGTRDVLRSLSKEYTIHLVEGNGSSFYSGGMRIGMEYALKNLPGSYDYMLMINDDVEFFEKSIQSMISQSVEQNNAVIIGAMCNEHCELSYGAVKYTSGYKYRKMSLSEWATLADTFNANCVLITYKAFETVGAMDSFYCHSLGDFDYGLSLKNEGYQLYQSKEFVGRCNNNDNRNTWSDTSLSRRERIKKKESVKGAPTKQWFYFLRKNFGFLTAIKGCITPYIRILLKK